MRRSIDRSSVLCAGLVVILLLGSSVFASAQAPQSVGRYQLVSRHEGTVFLVDTVTGRVWRYSTLTDDTGSPISERYCHGL
jgi:hypothetical protein